MTDFEENFLMDSPQEIPDLMFLINEDENFDASNELSPSDMKYSPSIAPIDRAGPPPRGDFPGAYNFEVELSGENADSSKYVYSYQLNRVYMVMTTKMAVSFKWDWARAFDEGLWVRATPIFSGNECQESRVLRCFNHRVPTDPSNKEIPKYALDHVMHSVGTGPNVVYCGAFDDSNQWLSVSVLYHGAPPIGTGAYNHVYRFGCTHSCTSGIDRRRMEILFTLENSSGEILGRRSLGVRICSCPKRDMAKDLKEYGLNGPPKKRKLVKPTSEKYHPAEINTVSTLRNYKSSENIISSAITAMQLYGEACQNESAALVLKHAVKELSAILKDIKK